MYKIKTYIYNKTTIKIKRKTKLSDHVELIKCAKLSHKSFFCSCSADKTLVWTIDHRRSNELICSKRSIISDSPLTPNQCCFHPDETFLAISLGNCLNIYDIQVKTERHTKNYLSCNFKPIN